MRRSTSKAFFGGVFILLFILMANPFVLAEEFPALTETPVQVISENSIFSSEKIEQINQELINAAHPTKVLIFETIDEDLGSFAQTAFANYNFPKDQLFIVFELQSGQMTAVAGNDLAEQGITPEIIKDKISIYFDSFANTKNYLDGISVFVDQVFAEIQQDIENSPVTEPLDNRPTLESEDPAVEQSPQTAFSWFFIVSIFLIGLVILFILIMWQRNRIIKRLDQLEEEKEALEVQWAKLEMVDSVHTHQEEIHIRLQNIQNVYEDYRNRVFPLLTEEFVEIEQMVDRFRLFAANEGIQYIAKTLQEAQGILDQFNHQMKEMANPHTEVPLQFDQVEKKLYHVKKKVHALCSQYGVTFKMIKEKLKQLEQELQKNRLAFQTNKSVDYIGLETLEGTLAQMDLELGQSDPLVQAMEELIPNRLKQLEAEYKETNLRGELENSTLILEAIKVCREKWNSLITLWDDGNLKKVSTIIQEIELKLSEAEEILRKEEDIRKEIIQQITHYETSRKEIASALLKERGKLEKLIKRYQLEEDPALDLIRLIDQQLEELEKIYQKVLDLAEQRSFKEALESAKPLSEKLASLFKCAGEFQQRISDLSLEEERSVQELKSLRNRLRLLKQNLDRSLLPGNHEYYQQLIETGYDGILATEVLFDQIPLRLNKIALHLQQAMDRVTEAENNIGQAIYAALETERIIRSLNLYRFKIPQVGQLLMMAENHFRDCEFEEALSVVQKAEMLVQKKRA